MQAKENHIWKLPNRSQVDWKISFGWKTSISVIFIHQRTKIRPMWHKTTFVLKYYPTGVHISFEEDWMIIFQIIFVKHPGYPFCDQRIIHDNKQMHYKIKTLIVHVQLWAYRNKSSTIMTHHWSFERPHSGIPKIMILQITSTHLQSYINNVSEAMLYICIAISDQTVTVYLRGSWLEGICTISYTQIQLSERIIWSQHNNSDTNNHIKDICRYTS